MILLPLLIADILINLAIWSKVNHTREAAIRFLLLVIMAVFEWQTVLLWPLYGCLFNLGLNIGRGLPLDYIGETSFSDKLMRRYRWVWWAMWGVVSAGFWGYIGLR